MRSEGYGSWARVCLSVCPCFNSPLECLFIPQTIPLIAQVTTISLIEPFFSEYAPLQRSERCRHSIYTYKQSAMFTLWKTRMRIFLRRGGSRRLFSRSVSSICAGYHVSEVCPQCQASLPLKLKMCKSCEQAFRANRKAEYSLSDQATNV